MGGPWLPSATAFFNVFLMASLKVAGLRAPAIWYLWHTLPSSTALQILISCDYLMCDATDSHLADPGCRLPAVGAAGAQADCLRKASIIHRVLKCFDGQRIGKSRL